MPAKTTQAAVSKQPAPANAKTDSARPNPVSFGLLSLLVGSVALSLYSVPYLLVRILAVLVSLGGIGLAVLQFRKAEKAGRNFNGAIAGTMFSAAVIVLTAIGPYLPVPERRIVRTPTHASKSKPPASATQITESVPQPKTSVQPAQAKTQTTPPETAEKTNEVPQPKNTEPSAQAVSQTTSGVAEKPTEVPQIPINVPKVIPFPCRKSFTLVPSGLPEWVDAASSAVLQGEVAVCVASAAIEGVELAGNTAQKSSASDNLVIHLQVMLIGTSGKVDFASWGNSNFGDARNKPMLTDNSNQAYQLRSFDAGTQLPGHERSKGLYPKLYADDYLIFETPNRSADYLRLELPASAFGGMGILRFQIPKSMIEGVKD